MQQASLISNINKPGFADTLHDTYLHTTRDLDSRLEAVLASFGQPNSNTTSTKAKDIASYYNAAARGARNSCFTLALHVAWPDRRRTRAFFAAICSLVPRPRPAFRRLQYGTEIVLIATESWAGPGNEASNLHRIPCRIGNTEIGRMECIWPFSAMHRIVDLCVVDRYVWQLPA